MALPNKLAAPPRSLSHYTTLEGLKGIVETNCLWASNASFLNDKAELNHALKAANQAILKLSSQESAKKWAPMLKRVIKEFENGGIPDTYVICFCRNDDNLSQWRGYGGNVQGVSVSFDRVKLTEQLKRFRPIFFKVRYTKLSTVAKLSDALPARFAILLNWMTCLVSRAKLSGLSI